jgi:hypothetical protein
MTQDFAEHAAQRDESPERRRPAAARNAIDWRALKNADRACCCAARPVVVAVLPPAPGRDHPTDLLLCGHHYQVSRLALAAADAAVLTESGRPVMPQSTALVRAG